MQHTEEQGTGAIFVKHATFYRLRRLPWAPLAAIAVCLAALPAAAQQQQKLVPANFNGRTDSQGFNWDVSPNGQVVDGTNDCFDDAANLRVNNQQFQGAQHQMTADGSEYVLTGSAAGLQVTRRVKIDL